MFWPTEKQYPKWMSCHLIFFPLVCLCSFLGVVAYIRFFCESPLIDTASRTHGTYNNANSNVWRHICILVHFTHIHVLLHDAPNTGFHGNTIYTPLLYLKFLLCILLFLQHCIICPFFQQGPWPLLWFMIAGLQEWP